MSRNFTAICFAISGIISCFLAHYEKTYKIQLTFFLVIGIFLILIVRPHILKLIENKKKKVTEEKITEENIKKENKSEKRKQKKKHKNRK